MPNPQRLFDCLKYQLETNPMETMMAAKENGAWKSYSTRDVVEIVNRLSAGMTNLGISAGDMSPEGRDKVAILSKNRPEWLLVDLAVQQIGAVLTPFYPTINVKELEYVLNDSQVKMILVNDEDLYLKVLSIQPKVPSLQHIFTFEYVTNASHWKDIVKASSPEAIAAIPSKAEKIGYKDLATIIYTSGTTGTPKGVMLSHENILSNVMNSMPIFNQIGVKGQIALSFLP